MIAGEFTPPDLAKQREQLVQLVRWLGPPVFGDVNVVRVVRKKGERTPQDHASHSRVNRRSQEHICSARSQVHLPPLVLPHDLTQIDDRIASPNRLPDRRVVRQIERTERGEFVIGAFLPNRIDQSIVLSSDQNFHGISYCAPSRADLSGHQGLR
ncbi:MAG: hypothetical protein CME26_13260 [Gemmatimonadetes bacterium]|nr:hypothetical protein [Gemmatimonadota bacterium]